MPSFTLIIYHSTLKLNVSLYLDLKPTYSTNSFLHLDCLHDFGPGSDLILLF